MINCLTFLLSLKKPDTSFIAGNIFSEEEIKSMTPKVEKYSLGEFPIYTSASSDQYIIYIYIFIFSIINNGDITLDSPIEQIEKVVNIENDNSVVITAICHDVLSYLKQVYLYLLLYL